ncbi:MAG: hypothetical protein V3S51_09115 [Dehalococcoidia bacterium]
MIRDEVSDPINASVENKKLAGLNTDSLMKRFNEKRFAAGAKREQIMLCEEIGLEEFGTLGIEAMQEVADELGL